MYYEKNAIKKLVLLLVCVLIVESVHVISFANDNVSSYETEILPTTKSYRNVNKGLTLRIIPSTSKYVHGNEIEVKVEANWPEKNWNASLDGTALVYRDEKAIMLMGSVCGDNYESENVKKFMGIDFHYDVLSGKCIATASYDSGGENEYFVEFGENSEIFSDAIQYLSSILKEAHKEQVIVESSNGNTGDSLEPRIDDGLYTYSNVSNNTSTVMLKMWGAKELLVSGSRAISTSVKGNLTNAENEILELEPTATNVVATRCNMTYSGSSEVRFANGEMKPKTQSSYVTFSIPLPGGQSYEVNWTVESIDATTGTDDKTTVWKVYDVSGIEELLNTSSTAGAAFQNQLYCAPSSIPSGGYKRITFSAKAQIGYHYIYIDDTGNLNNTTKYFEVNSATILTVVNP